MSLVMIEDSFDNQFSESGPEATLSQSLSLGGVHAQCLQFTVTLRVVEEIACVA